MAKKKKITVKCDNCKKQYDWIVPEGYDIDKDPICKHCKKGKVKEGKHGSNYKDK